MQLKLHNWNNTQLLHKKQIVKEHGHVQNEKQKSRLNCSSDQPKLLPQSAGFNKQSMRGTFAYQ